MAVVLDASALLAYLHEETLYASGWREGWPVVAADAAARSDAGGPLLPEPGIAAGPQGW